MHTYHNFIVSYYICTGCKHYARPQVHLSYFTAHLVYNQNKNMKLSKLHPACVHIYVVCSNSGVHLLFNFLFWGVYDNYTLCTVMGKVCSEDYC